MESTSSKLQNLKLNSPKDEWRVWLYHCPDFPQLEQINANEKFRAKVQKMLDEYEEEPVFEEPDNWRKYLKRYSKMELKKLVASIIENIGEADQFSSIKLAGKTDFNHKHGYAIFRSGIPFDYVSPENLEGGIFRMLMFVNAGDILQLTKFDDFLCKVLTILDRLPDEVVNQVNGLFVYSSVDKMVEGDEPYGDQQNLPCVLTLEIWIKDIMDFSVRNKFIRRANEEFNEFAHFRRFGFRVNKSHTDAFKLNTEVWHFWRYNLFNRQDYHEHQQNDEKKNCGFCTKMEQFYAEKRIRDSRRPRRLECRESWTLFEDVLFGNNRNAMVANAMQGVQSDEGSSSRFAKMTNFDRIPGFGYFREGFDPNNFSIADNPNEDIFLGMLGSTGDDCFLTSVDHVVCSTFQLFEQLPSELAECVFGISVKCKIDAGTGKELDVGHLYENARDLPCMFTFKIWIRQNSDELHAKLIEPIKNCCREHNLKFGCCQYKSDRE